MPEMIYFDNAATTKVSKEAADAVYSAMTEGFGNPSSTHSMGIAARKVLSEAREKVSSALGASPKNIYFTSGGTEADNIAVLSGAELMKRKGRHVITTAIEHDAVLKSMGELERLGYEVEYLKPDFSGRIPVEAFEEALREDTVLISLMLVNNEVGSLLPVTEVSKLLKRRASSAILHTDAVQGFLELPFTVKTLGADMVSVSAHKIHGPKGVGALYVRDGLRLPPRVFGGGQESDLRPGTESLPLIAGFGVAAEAGAKRLKENMAHISGVKEHLRSGLKSRIPDIVFVGSGDAPHILCVSMPGYGSEVLLNWLDSKGICVSKGSACKRGRRSHVLTAMGLEGAVVDGALRISLCAENTIEEADEFIEALSDARAQLFGALGR